jgi:hypothetical protein
MQTIGNGIKIITNNKGLLNAPFYDPNMIYVFDPYNVDEKKIQTFIHNPQIKINNTYLDGLEINEWIKKL